MTVPMWVKGISGVTALVVVGLLVVAGLLTGGMLRSLAFLAAAVAAVIGVINTVSYSR